MSYRSIVLIFIRYIIFEIIITTSPPFFLSVLTFQYIPPYSLTISWHLILLIVTACINVCAHAHAHTHPFLNKTC